MSSSASEPRQAGTQLARCNPEAVTYFLTRTFLLVDPGPGLAPTHSAALRPPLHLPNLAKLEWTRDSLLCLGILNSNCETLMAYQTFLGLR